MKYDELDETIKTFFKNNISIEGLRDFNIINNEEILEEYLESYYSSEDIENMRKIFLEILSKSGSIKVVDVEEEVGHRNIHYIGTVIFFENFNSYVKVGQEGYESEGYNITGYKVVEPKEITKTIYVDSE